MGKKYIIEIPEDKIPDFVGSTHFLMPYMMAGHIGHHDTGLLIEPYTEPDLEQIRKEAYEKGREYGKIEGQAETWVCVKKIAFNPESVECVDDIVRMGFDVGDGNGWSEAIEELFEKYTASEAIEKIRQYEQEKDRQARIEYNFDEIKDVLETTAKECNVSLDEIAAVLQKMKEANND